MANAWQEIYSDFQHLMNVEIVGLVTGSYSESSAIDLKKRSSEPTSIWNDAYSIVYEGQNETIEYINGFADLHYMIVLQIAYELSYNDNKVLYVNAMKDIEEIIKKRLDPDTFKGSVILNVKHTGTSGLNFAGRTDNETFAVVEISFDVMARVTI